MTVIILSYFAAAIIPIILFLISFRLRKRIRFKKNLTAFWSRQSTESLKKIRFGDLQKMPEPLNFITEMESLQTTIQTISLSVELGLIDFIRKNPGIKYKQIKEYLNFSPRPIHALIEILLASEVIKQYEDSYFLTERAILYLLKESPFFQQLPPPFIGRRFLKIARSGVVKGTINKWSKGKTSLPENWAMQQHQYSFPLGFALYDLGLIKGKNIVDIAGGTGAVCIALALKDPSFELKLIELLASIDIAKKMIARYELSDRIKCIGMDMFKNDWPDNIDSLLFTNIFHDWDDDHCNILATKAFNALCPGGVILIQEALFYDSKPGPLWTAHWSMAMALFMQGRQFHSSELKKIVEDAGFIQIQIHSLLGYYSTVIGVKP